MAEKEENVKQRGDASTSTSSPSSLIKFILSTHCVVESRYSKVIFFHEENSPFLSRLNAVGVEGVVEITTAL